MTSGQLQARLEKLIDQGWGEWLLRHANTPKDAERLVDYEAHRRRRVRIARAKATYHRKRMRCILKYIREGRLRYHGVLMESVGSKVFRIEAIAPTNQVKIKDKTANAPYAEQDLLTQGASYRISGLHRSELTGGWVQIMDCDVEGTHVRSPTIKDTEFTEFDNLTICEGFTICDDEDYHPYPNRKECDPNGYKVTWDAEDLHVDDDYWDGDELPVYGNEGM